jgi:hypothetical protein
VVVRVDARNHEARAAVAARARKQAGESEDGREVAGLRGVAPEDDEALSGAVISARRGKGGADQEIVYAVAVEVAGALTELPARSSLAAPSMTKPAPPCRQQGSAREASLPESFRTARYHARTR